MEDDKSLQRGQGPNLVGLDVRCNPPDPTNAVKNHMSTIEGRVMALDAK